MHEWLGEENSEWGISLKTKISKLILKDSSRNFEEILVGESKAFGRVLVLKEGENYTWQVAERWDSYSEMLVHVPLCAHPNPRRVLVIGGGDGSTVREVLKHDEVREVMLVDIDEKIVSIGKHELKIDNGALIDERVKIVIENAVNFVKNYVGDKFDIVIGDYSDPQRDSPAADLIKEDFLKGIKSLTKSSSIIAMQAGSPIFQRDIFIELFRSVKKTFKLVYPYVYTVPFYPGGLWSFVAASDTIDPRKPIKSFKEATFYNAKLHVGVFRLPTFMIELLDEI